MAKSDAADWLFGGGEMGRLIRAFDWATTPLGARADWPQSLRAGVGICINSRFPMFLWCGKELINIYNDAYAPMLGKRHPGALGQSAHAIWKEIWTDIGPQAEAVFRGESTWNERRLLMLERNGYPEECYFTFSYSPIWDESGKVGALFCAITEETQRTKAEAEARDAEQRWQLAVNSANDGIWDWNPVTDALYWSPRCKEMLGYADAEVSITRETVRDWLHPQDRERAWERARQHLEGGSAHYSDEYRLRHKDGSYRWVLARGLGYRDAAGPVVRFAGSHTDITEQKLAENALREMAKKVEQQSRLFEQIASATPDFIYVIDPRGRFLYANRRLLEVWGTTFEQAIGKTFHELGYPQWHAEMHMRELRHVIETKQPVKGEVPFTGGSGIAGVYEYIFTPVFGADGKVEAIAGTTRDVTDRQKIAIEAQEAKAAVEASLDRWQAVVANMAEGVVLVDADGNMLDWNRAALDMHGFADMRQVHHHIAQFVPGFEIRAEDGSIIPFENWPIPRLLRGEAFKGMEVELRRLDKPLALIVSFSGTALRDREGRITLALLTLHDMTEERQAQRALRESEAAFREMFEQTPIGMTLNELSGRYLHVNPSYCRIVGYTREQLLDRDVDFRALIHPEDRPRMLALQAQVIAGEIPAFFLEKRYVCSDGSVAWVRVTGTVRRDAAGKPIQFMRLVEDINDRKRAEAELEQLLSSERAARAEAERAGRMKDEFLATLSHELRTPLNAILGWSQILSHGSRDQQDLSEGLNTIERNARAQAQIIEDLLDMSRIISGKVRLDVQRIDLASVVQAAVETVRPAADAKGVRLYVVLDPLAAPVSGDPNRLQQVFWNLLNNAVKFTAAQGRVQVVLERVNSHLELSVADTGEGISPEFLPHVFDRFRQADASSTRRHGGLGLGLAIVKQLVELHGGAVRAKSPGVGRGSTFIVSLPLVALHPEPLPPPERQHPSAQIAPMVREACDEITGLKVLVADDEADARLLIKRLLEDCKAIVVVAASAAQALELVQTLLPDVLISDIGMPGEDGYSLVRRVRALPPERGGQTPAIALTAYARAEDRVKALRAGFQHHVSKPVEPAELIAMVANLAKQSSGTNQT